MLNARDAAERGEKRSRTAQAYEQPDIVTANPVPNSNSLTILQGNSSGGFGAAGLALKRFSRNALKRPSKHNGTQPDVELNGLPGLSSVADIYIRESDSHLATRP